MSVDLKAIISVLSCDEPRCSCGKPAGTGEVLVHCPAHNDQSPSLSVSQSEGRILVHCHAGCSQTAVIEALKARDLWPSRKKDPPQKRKIVATYNYTDGQGTLIFQVCRYRTPKGKTFKQRRPDGSGGWIYNVKGIELVPFRLPQLLKTNIAIVTEGEKDVEAVESLGFTATTNPGGAGRWPERFNHDFQGKEVYIIPDNDAPGRAHSQNVAHNLFGVAALVKVVELPGLQPKGDISDWIRAGGTAEQLRELMAKAPEWKPTAALPKIVITARFLHEKSNEGLEALQAANSSPFVFRRFGTLARIFLDETDTNRIENLSDLALRGILARAALFFKETHKGLSPTSPPMEIPRDILTRGEWPEIPPLDGISHGPILRPDGSIFSEPGYDPSTKLFNIEAPDLVPTIPPEPTKEEIDLSLSYLHEIICDFPFCDQSDRANALGLFFTVPLRPAILGNTPLAVITAPAPGTGKTLLADIAALIGTNKVAPMGGVPRDDEEMRKAITSRLLSGDPLICFDNIEFPLRAPSLSRALTCTTWEDRILGQSTIVHLPQRMVWIATGNNLQLRGDLPRRTFPIRLDAQLSKPWERQNFRHNDLKEWVSRNRGDFLAAIFTIARAWFVAGKPEPRKILPIMGGFEEWANTIGGILSYAGVDGFLENLKKFHEEADLEGPEWEGFLNAWVEIIGSEPKTSQQVAAICRDNDEFAATLPDSLEDILKDPKKSFERSLGRALSRKEKRPFGEKNLALQRVGTDKRSILWKVCPLMNG